MMLMSVHLFFSYQRRSSNA